MTFFSSAISRVHPSPTIAMSAKAAELKAAGREIASLTAGEPDFDTPAHIREAGISAIEGGKTRYTAVDGIPELKHAICEKFRRENGLEFAPENISVGSGGKHILFNALMATVNPGDEVIIPSPYWVSYPDIVKLCGGTPVIVPCAAETGFKLTAEALKAAITPRTKWLMLNTPSNPSGAAYSSDELKALADVLERAPNIWVLSDDIYEHLLFDGRKFATMAQVAPKLRDRTLTMNGVSKAYAMTGWRIGYAAGPKPLIDAMRKLMSQSTSNPCTISQWASVAALSGPQDFITEACKIYQNRRDLVVDALERTPGWACARPDGAFYAFPNIMPLIGTVTPEGRTLKTDEDVAMALLEEAGVGTVFGSAFGMPGHIRLSYAVSTQMLNNALERIAQFTGGLKR